ncbi:hypothetical protein Dimus_006960 [Dionaea muscipula]
MVLQGVIVSISGLLTNNTLELLLQMSLYIGNLSPHIHKDELEIVFRRFGHCTIRLKDGYGFAVYNFRPNAEKALRALRGRKIFGVPMSLSWSNMQPRPFQRFARGARQFQMHRRRNSSLADDFVGQSLGSEGALEPDDDVVRHESSDIHDKGGSFRQNQRGGHHDRGDDLLHNGGSVDPNQVGDDRWGERVDHLSNENQNENEVFFDRYEPDLGHEIEGEDESQRMPQFGSYVRESSPDRVGMEQIGDVAWNQQLKPSHRRRKLYISERQGNDEHNSREGETEWGLSESRSQGRMPSRKNSPSGRHYGTGKRALARELNSNKRKDSGGKRHSGRENVISGGNQSKKARRAGSSPPYAECTVNGLRSLSTSPKSIAGSDSGGSRLRSLSSGSRSLSYSSRSKPQSWRSRSLSVKSKSKCRSSSHTSLSLSVSLGRPLSSPTIKAEVDTAGSLGIATSPAVQETLLPGKQVFHENPSISLMLNENVDEDAMKGNNETSRATPSALFALNDKVVSRVSSQDKSLASPVLEEDTSPSLRSAGVLEMEKIEAAAASASQVRTLNLLPEELYRVLKHYGLKYPEENERRSTAGDHFGAARLWPWEIIYYRKLKKGPISTENYARRLSQNKEYNIIDKYIRSSTGWGESVSHCPRE